MLSRCWWDLAGIPALFRRTAHIFGQAASFLIMIFRTVRSSFASCWRSVSWLTRSCMAASLRLFERLHGCCAAAAQTSNQPMKPTQHFVVSFTLMHTPILKVLGGLSLSRWMRLRLLLSAFVVTMIKNSVLAVTVEAVTEYVVCENV